MPRLSGFCAVLKDRRGVSLAISGGYGEGETPLPIPNRAVKPLSADGTWPARAWESRSPPVYLSTSPARRWGSCCLRTPGGGTPIAGTPGPAEPRRGAFVPACLPASATTCQLAAAGRQPDQRCDAVLRTCQHRSRTPPRG